jgi:uncharacterized protein (TIGR04551 family)
MRRWLVLLAPTVIVPIVLSYGAPAHAQFGPGGMGPGGGAPQPGTPAPEKEEGPAEAAPEEKGEGPALQPLPAWPQQKEKALQFFQLNGYLRFRAYLFHALNLGIWEGATGPRAPFPIPYSEIGSTGQANPPAGTSNPPSSCASRDHSNCRTDNLTSADMRMRLEPTINVTEQVRVKAQIDVFDNLVLGSTPQGYYLNQQGVAPYNLLAFNSQSQQAPVAGSNSVFDSVRAKRAWAEVRTPFGELRFGRMPSHWGMGMLVNNGDCLDCDFGSNVDRVMFSTKLWGHFIAFLWDWAATGPTTQIIGPQQGQGVFYNADTLDDVSQWILALGRMDKPEEIKEKLDQGRMVFNYGGYFIYRQQDWAESVNPATVSNNDPAVLQSTLHHRGAKAFTPDIWLRLNWKKLEIQLEGALIVGQLDSISDVAQYASVKGAVDILSGGFALKSHYKLLHDALKIYLEVGYASGDSAESVDASGNSNAVVNYRLANVVPFGNAIHHFYFDPDYHVDLILFRRILGTVNNAAYFKPGVSYDIVDNFGARVDLLYAIADNPIAYPGNSYNLGLEIDAALLYKNEEEGFYASLVYGVLFPFDALSLPAGIYGSQFAHSADTAQTFQARLAVKF